MTQPLKGNRRSRLTRNLAAIRRLRYQLLLASPLAIRTLSNQRYVAKKVRSWAEDLGNLKREVRRLYDRDLRALDPRPRGRCCCTVRF